MVNSGHYRRDRLRRERERAAKRLERQTVKASRNAHAKAPGVGDVTSNASSSAPLALSIEGVAMARLAKAVAFICGSGHPSTLALVKAAESGTVNDIKEARALFDRLGIREQRTALMLIADA